MFRPLLAIFRFLQSFRSSLYRVSQEECARLRESVPYCKLYRYNPKHLYPNLNGYGDNGRRNVWTSGVSTYCTPSVTSYSSNARARQRDMVMQWPWRVRYSQLVNCEVQTCLLCFPTWNIAICILCTDFAMAKQVLLSTNIEKSYPERGIPSRGLFTRVQQTLRDNGCLPSVAVQSEREMVRRINTRENVLEMM